MERRLINKLIKAYFYEGYTYETISDMLYCCDNISVSLRQVKRILQRLGLRRRVSLTKRLLSRVREAINKELLGSGCLLGYRQMWKRVVQKYKLPVCREVVRKLLQLMAPEETRLRKRHRLQRRMYHTKGPNQVWHVDGYDKLKPYGFAIHGCIDGYSRKIIWLRVGVTNNKPSVIGRYFLDNVLLLRGVPSVLRSDLGTENSFLAWMQPFLRRYHEDSLSDPQVCFRYGKSVSNQRIEAWWSIFKKWNAAWWINLFKGLQAKALFDETDPLQKKCLRLAFMSIIQKELDQIVQDWNTHYIRKQRHVTSPCGVPNKLFTLPELHGAQNYMKPIQLQEVNYIRDKYTAESPLADEHFLQEAREAMHCNTWHLPTNVKRATKFYINMWTTLESDL